MTYQEFITKYQLTISEQIFNDWLPVAIVRAVIFPIAYRELATEFYLGYLLCISSFERSSEEIKKFEIKPEGYSVEYNKNGEGKAKCSNWLDSLAQLGTVAGIDIPELAKFGTLGGDRTECFLYRF